MLLTKKYFQSVGHKVTAFAMKFIIGADIEVTTLSDKSICRPIKSNMADALQENRVQNNICLDRRANFADANLFF